MRNTENNRRNLSAEQKGRRFIIIMAVLVLMLPAVFLLIFGFCLPSQFDETFMGELSEKVKLLKETEGKRIVLVGGSGTAFDYDSGLIGEYLPDHQTVNFGMYAGLGTKAVMDLSEKYIREGDIVILSPEQSEQTLSDYFNGEYFWQAADGNWALLTAVKRENREQLAGAFPGFAWEKFRYVLSGKKPETDSVYRKSSFNRYGDVENSECAQNIMALGYDANMPVRYDEAVLQKDFVEDMNAWAGRLEKKGAVVWYRFCPANALSVEDVEKTGEYYEALADRLDFPVIGDPADSIMDPEWFYDTNFHLNSSGKTVNTIRLIREIKAMLGDSSAVEAELPDKPDKIWEENPEKGQQDLSGNEQKIWTAEKSAGDKEMEEVTIPENITFIEDYSFDGCSRLKKIILKQKDPAKCQVGQHLLDGCNAEIYVPEESLTKYKLNYSWSVYSSRLKGYEG